MTTYLLLLFASLYAQPVQIETLDGTTASGTLRELSAERAIVETSEGNRSIESAQILQIGFTSADSQSGQASRLNLQLIDGSALRAESFSVEGAEALISRGDNAPLKLPLAVVASVHMADASGADESSWRRIVKEQGSSDVIVVRKKESLDYLEGVLHAIDEDRVRFEVEGETIAVPWEKVYGVIYFRRKSDNLPGALCRIYDKQGSELAARGLELRDNRLIVEPAAGGTVELKVADVLRLDYARGKVVYLSDLDWDDRSSRRTALFGPPMPIDAELDLFAPQRDRALNGGDLSVGGQPYSKGLALHSRTQIVYRLPAGFRRFTAIAGIDDHMDHRGNVELVIEADGHPMFQKRLAGGDPPLPIDLSVEGVKRLSILVDFGADQDVSDHLDLCDPKLIK